MWWAGATHTSNGAVLRISTFRCGMLVFASLYASRILQTRFRTRANLPRRQVDGAEEVPRPRTGIAGSTVVRETAPPCSWLGADREETAPKAEVFPSAKSAPSPYGREVPATVCDHAIHRAIMGDQNRAASDFRKSLRGSRHLLRLRNSEEYDRWTSNKKGT